jgi:hypothetical protein
MDLTQLLGPAFGVASSIRWIVTLIALSMALYLAWRTGNEKSLQRTIDVQREQLKILDEQNKTYKEKSHECDLLVVELKREVELLRLKTDLSTVYEMISTATAQSREKYDAKFETISTKLDILMSTHADKKSSKRGSSEG